MSTKTKFIIFIVLVVALVVSFGIFSGSKPGKLDQFTQCIKSSGAKFYGTFWCSHCQNQKKMFGSSARYLPYIECSESDGQNQKQICKEAGIDGYPTWVFSDGKRISGEISLEDLSNITQCVLSQ